MKRNFENIEKLEDIEQHLDSPEFYLYLSLIEETDKFIEKKLDVPPTDWSGSLAEVILPYLEKYKISNYDKLVAISKYAGKKQTSVEQIRQEIYDYSVEYETKKAENFSKNLQNKLINLDTILFTNNPQVLKKNTIYITNAQIFQMLQGGFLAKTLAGKSQMIFIISDGTSKVHSDDIFLPFIPIKYTGNFTTYTTIRGDKNSVPVFTEVLPAEYKKIVAVPQTENFYFVDKPQFKSTLEYIALLNPSVYAWNGGYKLYRKGY